VAKLTGTTKMDASASDSKMMHAVHVCKAKDSDGLGHVFRMPNDRLPKKLLFGQVKGLRPPGRPRSSFNDVAVNDCQTRRISRPYRDAQDRLLWKDKTCPART